MKERGVGAETRRPIRHEGFAFQEHNILTDYRTGVILRPGWTISSFHYH